MNASEVRCLLIDAGASLHRYVRDGKTPLDYPGPSVLRRLLEDLALYARRWPTARAALVFDGGRGWRRELYAAYKAHRVDDEYRNAFVLAVRYVEARLATLGAPVVLVSDVEADDLISIMAGVAGNAGVPTVIVSDDGDLYQCLSAAVGIYRPHLGEFFDVTAALTKWHGSATLFRTWKALAGDSSDNLPGVPGVGEKRAFELIAMLYASGLGPPDHDFVESELFEGEQFRRMFGKAAWFRRLRESGRGVYREMLRLVSTALSFDELCPPELAHVGGWWLVPGAAKVSVEAAFRTLAEPRPIPEAWNALRREADLWSIAESDLLRVLSVVPPSPFGSVPRLVFPAHVSPG